MCDTVFGFESLLAIPIERALVNRLIVSVSTVRTRKYGEFRELVPMRAVSNIKQAV